MDPIQGIGFDLFNTLITADPAALGEAMHRMIGSLRASGIGLEMEPFQKAYREAAMRFVAESKAEGKETHNRFWISAALRTLGRDLGPEDTAVAKAVEAYFSTFLDYCRLIPQTLEMLALLKGKFRLGLLSNFTHAPAVEGLLNKFGLTPFFDTVLVSGALGFRKPHPLVFEKLVQDLSLERKHILYVGDSLDPDVTGAVQAGLRPVWMTYVQDHHLPVFPPYSVPSEQTFSRELLRVSNWEEFLNLLGLA
ncbi:MAG: HAD family hydrolase [Thermodesulfobacteriota bacterium]